MPEEKVVRLQGRNGEIWKEYCRGSTQERIAQRYGITQQAVSHAIRSVRDSIPMEERIDVVKEEIDFFRQMRLEVMDLWDMGAAPMVAGKDGEIIRDPETGQIVRDHSGRLNAVRAALQVSERMHKLLGLDAVQKVELNVGEAERAKVAGAEALNFLHGETTDA